MSYCDINGIHCVSYYCGKEHFIINTYEFANKPNKEKQLLYLYVESEFYGLISKVLTNNNIDIEFIDMPRIIKMYSDNGIESLNNYFYDCEEKAKNEGYSSVKIVNQVSYILKNVSHKVFVDFEEAVSYIIKDKNISMMCAFDFDDYINSKKVFNEEVIKQSLKNHSYRMYKHRLIENTRCME